VTGGASSLLQCTSLEPRGKGGLLALATHRIAVTDVHGSQARDFVMFCNHLCGLERKPRSKGEGNVYFWNGNSP